MTAALTGYPGQQESALPYCKAKPGLNFKRDSEILNSTQAMSASAAKLSHAPAASAARSAMSRVSRAGSVASTTSAGTAVHGATKPPLR